MSSWEKAIFGNRTSRAGFWFGLVGVYVLLLLSFLPFNLLGGAIGVCSSSLSKALFAGCLLIPSILLLRVSGRRLHDLGWSGWAAVVLPAFVFIEGDTVKDGVRYYCDVGVLSPLRDILSPLIPLEHWMDALSPVFAPFSFTLNGMEVDLVGIAIPFLLYLGFYPGMRGENRYGANPQDNPPSATAEGPAQTPTASSAGAENGV